MILSLSTVVVIWFVEKECTDVSLRQAFKLDALSVIIYRSNVHFHALMSLSLSSKINMHFFRGEW